MKRTILIFASFLAASSLQCNGDPAVHCVMDDAGESDALVMGVAEGESLLEVYFEASHRDVLVDREGRGSVSNERISWVCDRGLSVGPRRFTVRNLGDAEQTLLLTGDREFDITVYDETGAESAFVSRVTSHELVLAVGARFAIGVALSWNEETDFLYEGDRYNLEAGGCVGGGGNNFRAFQPGNVAD